MCPHDFSVTSTCQHCGAAPRYEASESMHGEWFVWDRGTGRLVLACGQDADDAIDLCDALNRIDGRADTSCCAQPAVTGEPCAWCGEVVPVRESAPALHAESYAASLTRTMAEARRVK